MKGGNGKFELFQLPVNWQIKEINQVTSYVDYRGKTPPKVNQGIRLVTAKNIKIGRIDYDASHEFIPESSYLDVMSRGFPVIGDVLITTEAPLGNIASVDRENIALAQRVIKYRGKEGVLINDYLKYFMLGPIFQDQLSKESTGSTVKGIKGSRLHKLKVFLPPLPEQEKIAAILSAADEKIDLIDQQLAETQALKRGMMQRLLTQGIGHTQFQDSPLGKIPESWEVVKIEDIADVKGGKRLPKGSNLVEEPTNHPYIRVADMYMGGVALENILYVPDDIFPSISRYTISKDDLFISVAGTIGIVGKIPDVLHNANLTENADKFTNISLDKDFLLQVLLSPMVQDAVQREQTNNAQPKLALTRIRTFLVPKPSLDEQKKIAAILSFLDQKLQTQTEKKTAYQTLKTGLMQQLLTGKTRVKLEQTA